MKKFITTLIILCLLCMGGLYAASTDIGLEALWNRVFDTTNNAIQVTISGVANLTTLTVVSGNGSDANKVVGLKTISVPVTNPAGSEDFLVWRAPWDVTVRSINGVAQDGTSLTCTFAETDADGVGRTALGPQTAIGTTNTAVVISNPSLDAGDYLSFVSTAEAGDVTKMILTLEFTVD